MSIVTISVRGYKRWEADKNKWALEIAEDLIRLYNAKDMTHEFGFGQTSVVMNYIMMKVWHILSCSGIFLDYKVKKKKDECSVVVSMCEQVAEHIDPPDEEVEEKRRMEEEEKRHLGLGYF